MSRPRWLFLIRTTNKLELPLLTRIDRPKPSIDPLWCPSEQLSAFAHFIQNQCALSARGGADLHRGLFPFEYIATRAAADNLFTSSNWRPLPPAVCAVTFPPHNNESSMLGEKWQHSAWVSGRPDWIRCVCFTADQSAGGSHQPQFMVTSSSVIHALSALCTVDAHNTSSIFAHKIDFAHKPQIVHFMTLFQRRENVWDAYCRKCKTAASLLYIIFLFWKNYPPYIFSFAHIQELSCKFLLF